MSLISTSFLRESATAPSDNVWHEIKSMAFKWYDKEDSWANMAKGSGQHVLRGWDSTRLQPSFFRLILPTLPWSSASQSHWPPHLLPSPALSNSAHCCQIHLNHLAPLLRILLCLHAASQILRLSIKSFSICFKLIFSLGCFFFFRSPESSF